MACFRCCLEGASAVAGAILYRKATSPNSSLMRSASSSSGSWAPEAAEQTAMAPIKLTQLPLDLLLKISAHLPNN